MFFKIKYKYSLEKFIADKFHYYLFNDYKEQMYLEYNTQNGINDVYYEFCFYHSKYLYKFINKSNYYKVYHICG